MAEASYLEKRLAGRPNEVLQLSQLHTLLRALLEECGRVDDRETPVISTASAPCRPGWVFSLHSRIGKIPRLPGGAKIDDPVMVFVTPETLPDGSGFKDPTLNDDHQLWLIVGSNGAMDEAAGRQLDDGEVAGLYNDMVLLEPALRAANTR